MHDAYAEREAIFAAVMADRADWEQATRQQRHLAIAADAELRRRHPDQHYPPLRPAEPVPATQAQRDELTLTAGEEIQGAGQWIKELAVQRRAFKDRLSERRCLLVPAEDPDCEHHALQIFRSFSARWLEDSMRVMAKYAANMTGPEFQPAGQQADPGNAYDLRERIAVLERIVPQIVLQVPGDDGGAARVAETAS
jgi:hypothetical protein